MLNFKWLVFGIFVFASGCDLIPRGAGVQSEILAARTDNDAAPEFALETITRENLVTFLAWPDIELQHLHWIRRVDQPNNRVIRAGDQMVVTVWSTEENGLLTGPGQRSATLPVATVSSAGNVFLPFVGDIRVSGLSPARARARIEEAYGQSMQSPQVQVEVSEGPNQTVTLVSGVGQPGLVTLPHSDFTVLELLADGGGIHSSFVNPQVRLQRGSDLYGISAGRLLDNPQLNTTLQGGDRVFVKEDDRTFLSLGASGTEAIHLFPKDTVTALEALSIIGGVADSRADAKGILILRRYPVAAVTADRSGPNHPRTVFTIDLTSADGLFSADQFVIQPGDLIYVTESPLVAVRTIFGLVSSVLGLNNQL